MTRRVVVEVRCASGLHASGDGDGIETPNLIVCKVDEAAVALRKDTVTVIDERDPEKDADSLQLTNFSLLEDRETQTVELYLTRLGQRGTGPDTWTADTFRYTVDFV